MAQNDNQEQQNAGMPDVEQKPAATAGKWAVWFIIILAIVLTLCYVF